MSKRAHGQIRRGQVITTYGPGALIDLPTDSAIVGGLDTWPKPGDLQEIFDPRLTRKLEIMTGVSKPRLYLPPPDSNDPRETARGIGVWGFPEWFVVQESAGSEGRDRSRRLVHRKALDGTGRGGRARFEGQQVVATRFVRACPKGHVDDLDWRRFVHESFEVDIEKDETEGIEARERDMGTTCRRQLWLDERGTSGDLSDLFVRCECGKSRGLYQASVIELNPLGACHGARPWLGKHAKEGCGLPSRLLIRTASNAYFPQVVSVLSLPDRGTTVETAVRELWDDLEIVEDVAELALLKRKPKIATKLAPFSDQEVFAAIQAVKGGGDGERPVKQVELEAILAAEEGFGDDVPVDPEFHARRLPDRVWRKPADTEESDPRPRFSDGIEAVVQLHRLREILALVGFTRFEAVTPDTNGEYETDVERAHLALEPQWFPAVENRGEGIFIQFRESAVKAWSEREAVIARIDGLIQGHDLWMADRKSKRPFPGGPYVLLHTLSHLLIQSIAMRCGYPASSIRERIYADREGGPYGILLYTGSPDAEGTLGGLVQQARHVEDHLLAALRMATLCSNDPICAQHEPGASLEKRWLHGAACHGCTLVAETSCEMRNDYLDRALVVSVVGGPETGFFEAVP